MIPNRINRAVGAAAVEALLAIDQQRFFAAIGDLVLEVGCATGALAANLAARGYRVSGLDRSDDMIRRARSDHPHLDLCVGDATALPYDDNAFDGVVAASVINIVPDGRHVLFEMHRVCTPGGAISVLAPATDFTDEDLDTLIETLGVTGFSQAALTKWHRGPSKMSRPQLEALFRSAGLDSVATGTYLDGMLISATARTRSS